MDGVAVYGLRGKDSELVAVIRVDAIGDFILWLSSAKELRRHFNGHRLVLICDQAIADLATRCGYFDDVLSVDLAAFIRNPLYRWKIVRSVRRFGAAVALQPTHSRVFVTGDALVRATGATERVGSSGDLTNMRTWQRRLSNRWYTRLIDADPTPLMEIERNVEFLRGLGLKDVRPTVAEMPNLTELGQALKVPGDYFIVFPGASSIKRMWPVDHFAASARSVGAACGWRMVVCGTGSESTLARAVIEQAGLPGAMNLAGQTSLPEFVELVRGARLLIGNETSAVHIAAAVGTPSVCLLGGGHFERFMPYSDAVMGIKPVPVFERMDCFGCNWRCVKPHKPGAVMPCVAAIPVDAVIDAAHQATREGEI